MAPALKPFQLLEINVISAQDLEPVSKKMKTYATAWVNTRRKLSSRVDAGGHVNPTWNDKFVFRVDEEFLRQDTSAVQIEIHAVHWFKDTLVGSVRVLVGNLIPPLLRSQRHNSHVGMRFVALQVRRPSGRPQGILNIGVTLLDSSMRSMPLYTQLSTSAVGYRDFMGEDDSYLHNTTLNNGSVQNSSLMAKNTNANASIVKPILRRTKSERSERVTFDNSSTAGSMVSIPLKKRTALEKDNSIISISNEPFKGFPKKGKASSVISGAELREKKSHKGRGRKGSSVVSDSIMSKESSFIKPTTNSTKRNDVKVGDKEKVGGSEKEKTGSDHSNATDPQAKGVDDKYVTVSKTVPPLRDPPKMMAIGKPIPKLNGYEYGGPRMTGNKYVVGAPYKANSIWSDSEVGPSPSEVAAAMAERKYPLDEERSSVLDGWSIDESVEGLRSKLERWRTELPPLYDRGYASSSFRSTGQHKRRNTDGSTGMFSCFGNIYGYECQCICGKPPERKTLSARYQSPSVGSRSFF
ncbi:OLC1v1019522C1 [Oldenlandia corymbosa var. corymbosa]|uniref:OLC1v1019522C1 n=1 Tax=Oldenlandia corymbosa var. corymbosa TaxID=529605 RepID=A0AAV1EEM1_OLDCO|nr:OLC1v1019522C1 [Oldenlandia corymbosa var. corymbosa]